LAGYHACVIDDRAYMIVRMPSQ